MPAAGTLSTPRIPWATPSRKFFLSPGSRCHDPDGFSQPWFSREASPRRAAWPGRGGAGSVEAAPRLVPGRSERGRAAVEPSASGLPPPAAGKRTELECDGGTGTARSSGSSRPCKGRAGAADIAKALGTRTFLHHPSCPGAPETAPELPKGCLGSAALLGCSKCRSAAVWVVILPMLLSNQHGSEFSGWAGRSAPAARFGAALPRVLRSPELP